MVPKAKAKAGGSLVQRSPKLRIAGGERLGTAAAVLTQETWQETLAVQVNSDYCRRGKQLLARTSEHSLQGIYYQGDGGVQGQPLVNGLFGVEKAGPGGSTQGETSETSFRVQSGDTACLRRLSAWRGVVMQDHVYLLCSWENLKGPLPDTRSVLLRQWVHAMMVTCPFPPVWIHRSSTDALESRARAWIMQHARSHSHI
eukprot:1678319-Amphidinium_carterae.1